MKPLNDILTAHNTAVVEAGLISAEPHIMLMIWLCNVCVQVGTHIRAKRKREELSNILAAMRKAAAKKE